jgi:2,3,4,5-tetrahydropyridine-2-carboxylate N-succinyltransferase
MSFLLEKQQIEDFWEKRDSLHKEMLDEARICLRSIFSALEKGDLRVCEKTKNTWHTHDWLKKAILLSFRVFSLETQSVGPFFYHDKVPLKSHQIGDIAFRAVPGSIVRSAAYIGRNVVLMPSFINVGAYVDEGTMVDTWSTIGSCAQIGKYCHISGGVGIGGVLEPLNAQPVIIEDHCFIGARSEIAEGVCVEEGAIISMGVFIGSSTKIVDRSSGEVFYGRVPAYSVVVPGVFPAKDPSQPSLACAVIVKRVDERTRSKVSINDLLRDL